MTLQTEAQSSKLKAQRSPAFALVTFIPLLWLLAVTGTAAVQKIWHSDPRIGFVAGADAAQKKREQLQSGRDLPPDMADANARAKAIAALSKQAFNLRLDAFVTAFFLALVVGIFLLSLREWILLLARRKLAELRETPPTWLPDYAVAEGRPLHVLSALALLIGLAKELSGESAVERARHETEFCVCRPSGPVTVNLLGDERPPLTAEHAYLRAAENRFRGVNRCC